MSFNDERVVSALNSLTVPVYLSNDLVVGAERTELTRIHQQGYAKKLSVGTVHAFLLAPDGTLLDTVHVAQGSPERYLSMIQKHASALKLTPGKPLLKPSTAALPEPQPGGQRLHVVARYLEKRADGTLDLVRNAGGNWSALPGEDWLVFTKAEWRQFCTGDRPLAERLLTHFYPPTENNNLGTNRFEALDWKAEPLGQGRVRFSGTLTLKHPFYTKDDPNRAISTFVGYGDERQFSLITTEGRYQNLPFGVAVRSG